MVEFLTTVKINSQIEDLIKHANQKLYLLSPYLQISDQIKELIEDKKDSNVDIIIIYRENDGLDLSPSVKKGICKNLHAKCYLNESKVLVTSMNLYEYSQVNNKEMGISISKDEDPVLYAQISEEVESIIRHSSPNNLIAKKNTYDSGCCIRCGKKIPLDIKHPYCKKCFNEWNIYQNEEYTERFCHVCGKPACSTINEPTCVNCNPNNKYEKYAPKRKRWGFF